MTYARDGGFVQDESPRKLHRLDAMTGRSVCDQPLVPLPAMDYSWATCDACYPAGRETRDFPPDDRRDS
jgi:hypothetical protein